MTDPSPGQGAEGAPAPARKPRLRPPGLSRNTGSFLLLLIALSVAVWLKEKDLVVRMINGLFDAGLLIWGTRPHNPGGDQ